MKVGMTSSTFTCCFWYFPSSCDFTMYWCIFMLDSLCLRSCGNPVYPHNTGMGLSSPLFISRIESMDAFIQEIKMAFQVFSLPRSQLFLCHRPNIQSGFCPRASQPENMAELRDKSIGNAPKTLHTEGQGFSGVDVIDAQSSLNHSWDLYLRVLRTAWPEHTLKHSCMCSKPPT